MLTWLSANLGNIIVILLLAAAVFFAVRSVTEAKRQGKSCCGSQCGSCPMGGACHSHKDQKRQRKAFTGN